MYFGRVVTPQVSNVYVLRMAGVFMISVGTIWWRTGLMPRWLATISFLVALTLLVVITLSLWLTCCSQRGRSLSACHPPAQST